ncbi:MAG: YtxH domain-containing protein [Candidatus Margulisiibacteriota bacterium]
MGKLLRGITIGGILGFIAGLLFAPEKGEETRKKVKEIAEKGKEKIKEIKEEFTKGKES